MNSKRKIIAIALACAMLAGTALTTAAIPGSDVPFGITVSAAEIVDSGSCGENVNYTLDVDGTLTISGTGWMNDYEEDESPFYNNTDIENIMIEDGVTSIGDGAFKYCTAIESVTIPDSVESIGYYAFYSCSSLTSITIPDKVEWIYDLALGYNRDPDSGEYVKRPGFTIYGYDGTEAERYANDNGFEFISLGEAEDEAEIIGSGTCGKNVNYTLYGDGTVIINGTGEMNNYDWQESPFYENYSYIIKKAIIEDGVTNIGAHVFEECEYLTDITIPDSVTSIGEGAFIGCESLPGITLPEVLTTIEDDLFFSCSSLTSITIPDGVTSIGESAFRKCTSLTNITIPEAVTSIGEVAFDGCSSLTEFSVDENNSAYSSSDGVLFDKNKETIICYPIGKALTEFVIPEGVTTIEDWAFNSCKSLTSITIPDGVMYIGDNTFADCESLSNITIPDSVTTIEGFAFVGCTALKSITIPDSVTTIEEGALGYYLNYEFLEYEKVPGFTISGYSGSEAERYAKDNEIEFIALSDDLLLGDITGDGSIDIADSLFIARADAGLAVLTDAQKQAADVNGDGSADIADALLIARVDAGLATL